MRTSILTCIMVVFLYAGLNAQQWTVINRPPQIKCLLSMVTDTVKNELVVLGTDSFGHSGYSTLTIGTWNGSQWMMSNPTNKQYLGFNANHIVQHNTDVFVFCEKFLKYTNHQWHQLPDTAKIVLPYLVSSMVVFNDTIYASGIFRKKENDTTWLWETEACVAYFDNNHWIPVSRFKGDIYKLEVYNNKLYILGSFTDSITNTSATFAVLDTSGFNVLDSIIPYSDFTRAGDAYYFTTISYDSIPWKLYRLDGNGLKEIPVSDSIKKVRYAMAYYDEKLILSGCFDVTIGGIRYRHIVALDTTGNLMSLLGGCDGLVSHLTIWNNHLVAGGYFSLADNIPASGLAYWSGQITHTVVNTDPSSGKPFPNPARDMINIPLQENTLKIGVYNLAGNLLVEYNAEKSHAPWHKLDLGNLPNGMYIVLTIGSSSVQSYKVKVAH